MPRRPSGRSMVIIGAAMNHWYHCDMNYRGVINMLVMCGCVGQSGGGWSHYVGQEKLRPQIGLAAARLRASTGAGRRASRTRPRSSTRTPTSGATRRVGVEEILSPTAPAGSVGRRADRLQRARRAHGLAAVGAAAQAEPAGDRAEGAGRRPRAEGLCRQGAEVRRTADVLRGPGPSRQLAAQHVRVALQPARLVRQGPRILPQAPARHHPRRAGQGPRRRRQARSRRKSPGTTRRRKESSTCW